MNITVLSSDSSHVIFRDISGKQKLRYFNLNLYPGEETTSSKIYNIKRKVDLMSPEYTLVMCEGIFDIIGVYNSFYKDNNSNNLIFAACCGKSYSAVISHFIRMGLLNLNIVIYSDADVPISFFKKLKYENPYIKNQKITIFYNKIEKDFGVPRERIELQKAII